MPICIYKKNEKKGGSITSNFEKSEVRLDIAFKYEDLAQTRKWQCCRKTNEEIRRPGARTLPYMEYYLQSIRQDRR